MCSIVTADMVRRQNECRQWKIRCALNESKEDAIKRFDRLWRSGMRASREDGVFWIHAIIQSTSFDETLRYCHCFAPVKLHNDQVTALKAAWECGCGISLSFSRSGKFGMEKHCYDISWHRWCGIMNGRRKDIFGNTKTGSLSVRYSDIRIMYNKKQIGRR